MTKTDLAYLKHQVRSWLRLSTPELKKSLCPWNYSMSSGFVHPISTCLSKQKMCLEVFPELAAQVDDPYTGGCTINHCPCRAFGLQFVKTRARQFIQGKFDLWILPKE